MDSSTEKFMCDLIDIVETTFRRSGVIRPDPRDVADKALEMYTSIMIEAVRQKASESGQIKIDWGGMGFPKV